jgi:hypothetical protein
MQRFLNGPVGPIMALVFGATLAGCAGWGYQDPNQPVVPIGSRIQLNLNAEVPLDENRIYIRKRMIVAKAQIDKEQVYCSVVMHAYQGGRQAAV